MPLTVGLLLLLVGGFFLGRPLLESAPVGVDVPPEPPQIVQPIPGAAVAQDTAEQRQIAAYVREVFGPDADLAFRLLACENSQLRPLAVNAIGNYPPGARDIGVFQINEYWQETQGKFLFNWKVNILVAKQLFDEQGGSFRLWSCGQKLGI
jgi:hypothetical protein